MNKHAYILIWHIFASSVTEMDLHAGMRVEDCISLLFSSLSILSCLASVSMSYKAGGTFSHKHRWRISLGIGYVISHSINCCGLKMTVNPSSLPRSFYLSVYLYLSRCLVGETALSSGRKQPGDLSWELSQSQHPACCARPIRCRRQPISRYRSLKLQGLNIRAEELQINTAERDLVTLDLTKLSQRRYMAWISQSPSWKIQMWIVKQSFEVYTSSLMGKGLFCSF